MTPAFTRLAKPCAQAWFETGCNSATLMAPCARHDEVLAMLSKGR